MEIKEFVGHIEGWLPNGKSPEAIAEEALSLYCPTETRWDLEFDLDGITDEVVAYVMATRVMNPNIKPEAMLNRLLDRFG